MPVELNESSFTENVFDYKKGAPYPYKGAKPVLLMYFASWCSHCKAMYPIMDEVAKELESEISFFKINLEHYPALGKPFYILSFPTFVLLTPNKRPELVVGEMTPPNFRKMVTRMLEEWYEG